MKSISALLVVIGIIWLSLFGFAWYHLYRQVAFHAAAAPVEFPSDWPSTTHFALTRDGFQIAYWYIPVPAPKAVVILIHGYDNPGGKSQMVNHAQYLQAAGYSTALVDLRSYGDSQGKLIGLGTSEWQDVAAVYDQLASLPENQQLPIGLFGISMGAATAIVTNGETGKGDFVIASVPYANLDSFFRHQLNRAGLPARILQPLKSQAAAFLLRSDYRTYTPTAQIKKVHVPIFIIAAQQDIEVNRDDAIWLYQLANKPKYYWQADAKHNIYHAQPDLYQTKILDFLSTHARN